MYFRSDTEAEFAAHLAIGWQLYKLHTLRLRYGCGIWRYTCAVIPHEPGSKNCSTVRSRHEMARPTRKCYRFRDKPCECFIGTLHPPRTNGRSRFTVGQRFIEENWSVSAAFRALVRNAQLGNELSFSPLAKTRQFFRLSAMSRSAAKKYTTATHGIISVGFSVFYSGSGHYSFTKTIEFLPARV